MTLQTWTKADDINDFEIEGFNLNVSLLNYFNKNEIDMNADRNSYTYTDKKFIRSTFSGTDYGEYDGIQITYKRNDKNYIIHSIAGGIFYSEFNDCLKQKNLVSKEISQIFKDAESSFDVRQIMPADKSEKSYSISDVFFIKNGSISARCTNWSDEMTEKYNWSDNLRVGIRTKEFNDWGLKFSN